MCCWGWIQSGGWRGCRGGEGDNDGDNDKDDDWFQRNHTWFGYSSFCRDVSSGTVLWCPSVVFAPGRRRLSTIHQGGYDHYYDHYCDTRPTGSFRNRVLTTTNTIITITPMDTPSPKPTPPNTILLRRRNRTRFHPLRPQHRSTLLHHPTPNRSL